MPAASASTPRSITIGSATISRRTRSIRRICEAAAAPSGREVDLPCFQYQQGDARYWGVEAELTAAPSCRVGGYRINADLLGDYVRATIVDRGPVPRIPPARVLGGVEAQGDAVTARVEVEHVFDQDRIAAFETPTDGYTLVNASVERGAVRSEHEDDAAAQRQQHLRRRSRAGIPAS